MDWFRESGCRAEIASEHDHPLDMIEEMELAIAEDRENSYWPAAPFSRAMPCIDCGVKVEILFGNPICKDCDNKRLTARAALEGE